MPLLALLVDAAAYFGYQFQQNSGQHLVGTIGQGVLVVLLLIMAVTYKGKRHGWFNFDTWARVWTLRYAIIMVSLLLNAVLLFLYVLNVTGTNSVIFG